MSRTIVTLRRFLSAICLALFAFSGGAPRAAPVAQMQVRIVTGALELSAGSVLELRIYEAGKAVRRIALSHGETWPANATRVIPITLNEPIEPRAVARFALYYRAASPLSPPWEVIAAEVDYATASGVAATGMTAPGVATLGLSERLLNTTLSGVIPRQGELASEERAASSLTCFDDSDCDDHRQCNGHEHCEPRNRNADARGCVKGLPLVCPINQVCTDDHGCLGPDAFKPK